MVEHAAEAVAHSSGHGMHFGLTFPQLVVWTWIVMGIILILVYLFMRKKEVGVPSKLQNVGEMIVEAILGILEPNIGHNLAYKMVPFFGTFLIFIIVSNFFLIVPWGQPPTSDLSTTVALAVIALVAVHFLNLKFNGLKDVFKRWFNPYPDLTAKEKLPEGAGAGAKFGSLFKWGFSWVLVGFLILMHFIDNGARLMSLSLRLFGNIFGEHVVFHRVSEVAVTKYFLVVTLFIPFIILLLDCLIFIIQAFVFTYLSIFYLIEEANIEH
jgi:F-type H+-transporting ATPase subunit a